MIVILDLRGEALDAAMDIVQWTIDFFSHSIWIG